MSAPRNTYLNVPGIMLTGAVPQVELLCYPGDGQPYIRLYFTGSHSLSGTFQCEDPGWLDRLAVTAAEGAAQLRAAIVVAGGEG